jgi:ribonuclease HI
VRDEAGRVIVSEWKQIVGCNSVEEAEVHAILAGIKQLINMRRWPATIESDCSRAVQMCMPSMFDRSEVWCLYEEVRELLKIFTQISIKKIGRESNLAAHSLAMLGKSGDVGILSGTAPDSVLAAVAHDCNL